MPQLATVIDKPEDVEEKHWKLYVKRSDGKYQLDADIEDVTKAIVSCIAEPGEVRYTGRRPHRCALPPARGDHQRG